MSRARACGPAAGPGVRSGRDAVAAVRWLKYGPSREYGPHHDR
jgi:hypothetical protein